MTNELEMDKFGIDQHLRKYDTNMEKRYVWELFKIDIGSKCLICNQDTENLYYNYCPYCGNEYEKAIKQNIGLGICIKETDGKYVFAFSFCHKDDEWNTKIGYYTAMEKRKPIGEWFDYVKHLDKFKQEYVMTFIERCSRYFNCDKF